MPVIPGYLGPASWGGSYPGAFRPNGPVSIIGDRSAFDIDDLEENPVDEESVEGIAAIRFFIGFNVGSEQKWAIEDVQEIVQRVRKEQTGEVDATFVAQTGFYTSRQPGREPVTVTEHGCQVFIVNMPYKHVENRTFKREMKQLGETLVRELKQEMIIGEWQVDGRVEKIWQVTP